MRTKRVHRICNQIDINKDSPVYGDCRGWRYNQQVTGKSGEIYGFITEPEVKSLKRMIERETLILHRK